MITVPGPQQIATSQMGGAVALSIGWGAALRLCLRWTRAALASKVPR